MTEFPADPFAGEPVVGVRGSVYHVICYRCDWESGPFRSPEKAEAAAAAHGAR